MAPLASGVPADVVAGAGIAAGFDVDRLVRAVLTAQVLRRVVQVRHVCAAQVEVLGFDRTGHAPGRAAVRIAADDARAAPAFAARALHTGGARCGVTAGAPAAAART